MKVLTYFIAFVVVTILVSCVAATKLYSQKNRHLLHKTDLDTTAYFYGQHIDVEDRRMEIGDTSEGLYILGSVDDRDIINSSKYSDEEKIEVLRQFLTFQGDTVRSNKGYFLHDIIWERPKQKEPFTIEVEALFSLTRMLTEGLPPIDPVIIERQTGKPINTDRKKMDEVYAIYKKWFADNSNTDFTDMSWPLAGTPYHWRGDDKDLRPFFKKSLR
ncbi:hypothetical protein F0L74_31515 [Chitinophaga agrisoli]|uniref:Lipoprotein n=1 Tax=Chitinophaga agrisoli TaxID=2607653 RepID=A0A5B2VPI1_9BACT|nr:hypothetical protein [Chitinophaga agrisoli]KAA2240674.1 hypothetical protein F0L74_31515 [Chitinophaga agrisoli]